MTPLLPIARRAALALLILPALSLAQGAPATGTEVLQRMHDAYAGRWYTTLRFVQKTTQYRPDGSAVHSTWYESLRHTDAKGTELRIDVGDPTVGNGVFYTADSSWSIRGGKLANAQAGGNVFLPVIEGVYLQPVAKTVAQLADTKIDFAKVTRGKWDGRDAWIVGVSSVSDSTSPQLWIDQERNVAVRMIVSPAPTAPPMDIHLADYVKLGDGWLATKVTMFVGGKPRQVEDYADWKAGMTLPGDLFAPAAWAVQNHWAKR